MRIRSLCAMSLLLVMLGCSKVTLDYCNKINVSFAGGKVLLFASSNLQ